MPERPRNDGADEGADDGGPQDDPHYQWLYGGAGGDGGSQPPDPTRPVRREERPDQTRVMRTQPRPATSSGSSPVPTPVPTPVPPPAPAPRPTARPTPPAVAPTPTTAPATVPAAAPPSRRRRRLRPRFRLRYVFLLLMAWLLFVVVTPVLAWRSIDKVDFDPGGDRPADQPGTTYLLVGSDSRAGLSKAERKQLATGNAAGGRTDTIMLLHTGSGPNLLLSIPRDSLVDIPGYDGENKINAAYAFGGPKLLVQTIEQSTGIRVDDFVEIGMDGVAGIVDSVGGVEVCPKKDMVDKLAGLRIKKGCQEVDGPTALAYARSRHTSGIGDIDRVRRQREVVSAVGSTVLSPWTVVNPVRWWRLNHAVPDFFTFGEGMGPLRIAMWATAMTRVGGDTGLTCVVPLQDLAVHWDPDRAPQMFDKVIKDDTGSITKKLCSADGGIR